MGSIKDVSKKVKIQQLKRETDIQKKIDMANKRLKRLEKNDLTNMSAYKNFVDYGDQPRFSVKGKDYNGIQQELSRLNKFLNNKTSLVRGANQQLKEISKMVGLKNVKVSEMNTALSGFFETASKVEQYLKNVEGTGSSIGYQKIWETINEYVETEKIDVEGMKNDMQGADEKLIELIAVQTLKNDLDTLATDDLWKLV